MAPKMPIKSKTRSVASSTHGWEHYIDQRMEKHEAKPKIHLQPGTRRMSPDQLVKEFHKSFARFVMVEAKCINTKAPKAGHEILLQPEMRPISRHGLVKEAKVIYAGLVMVKDKFIDIDERNTAAVQEKDFSKRIKSKNEQWQSLIALHRQLLHEHMLVFIYIAYSMMALLYGIILTFDNTWIDCLGELGRYLMAVEDDGPRDREVWSNLARSWYNKAADKNPFVGRFYHLAIRTLPYSLEPMSLYKRALTCVAPVKSAWESLSALSRPLLGGRHATEPRPSPSESASIKAKTDTLDESSTEHQLTNIFANLLKSVLDQMTHWKIRSTSCGKAPRSFGWSPVGAACQIRSSIALTFSTCTLFLVPTTARTIPRNIGNEDSIGSFAAAVIPLAHWPYLAFVIITLLVAQYLAHTKDPMFVWGCMMSIWAFGWWTVRADPSTTLPISVV